MGILERLNRTFTCALVCRHEVAAWAELEELVPRFRGWSNLKRWQRSPGYQAPWQRLLADVIALT